MGRYAEYLTNLTKPEDVTIERKKMLCKISEIREGRDILVISSDITKANMAPIGIDYSDLLATQDQLENMTGDAIDVILETPGGIGEVVEDIVGLIRRKYDKVGMIIPGQAKSAGTILVMAGDEILMGACSSLGPIDGQLFRDQGKTFSADAFLEGLEKIKKEVTETKTLNHAYIPILQNISPGEIQSCENIQSFSKHLATEWLAKYKFKNWHTHSSDGRKVTEKERHDVAKRIATTLCSQSKWLTHARSITIGDLEDLGVQITNYDEDANLHDAITRYYTLLRMSFESSGLYKLFETKTSQINRSVQPISQPMPQLSDSATAPVTCPSCRHTFKVQINVKKDVSLQPDVVPYPVSTDKVACPNCRTKIDVANLRKEVERQTGKRVV